MQSKLFFVVLFIFTFLTFGAAMAADSANVSNAEAKAKTSFDHIKLAEYYENEANALKAKAEEQRKLLEEYQNHSEYYGREGQEFESHHEALLREYTKATERNNEMAVSHRNMSKKVK
ncbi:hypothetical protein [Nitrosomonas sp.]|uniref:hypothetical protein n=1 Tax=Nitrosomonas sp. TaxID=42353 RepID=UPI0025D178C9|nr:hypothetical protein [Nitrosomonas sp.]MBY0483515.1 hypothetical protein [Nitrosomonas sp.]